MRGKKAVVAPPETAGSRAGFEMSPFSVTMGSLVIAALPGQ